jgi:hypothetical protein
MDIAMYSESFTPAPSPGPPLPPPLAYQGNRPPARGPTTAQVFLGLFVLGQLLFLSAANCLSIINELRDDQDDEDVQEVMRRDWKKIVNRVAPGWLEKKGHIHDALEVVRSVVIRWEELTNQPQYWKLFAPYISKDVTFVAVEFRWEEVPNSARAVHRPLAALGGSNPLGVLTLTAAASQRPMPYQPELLLSENEPANPRQFFRAGRFRLRKYESGLDVVLRVKGNESLDRTVDRWRDQIKDKVEKDWDNMLPYLRLRLRDFRACFPERRPPDQVILLVRHYRIPKPEKFSEKWYVPDTQPLARWQPGAEWVNGYLPIEYHIPEARNNRLVAGTFRAFVK